MKTYIRWLGLILIVLAVSYSFRWIFSFKFDPDYWENYYYHSQYNIPNSTRKIGDGEVYRYIGYRLVNGENPFNVDYWVPPLGKYLYGLSAKYFGNPYWTSYAFYLIAVVVFRLISKNIFGGEVTGWLVTYAYALNPLIINQLGATMLDLPQSVWLLIHVLFLLKRNIVASGFFLGLMAGTKIAYFVPVVLAVDWFYVVKRFNFKRGFWLLAGLVGGYMTAYFCYFIQHPNPWPWIKLHQKIIDYWTGGVKGSWSLNQLLFVFGNYFKGKFTDDWSPWLPVGLVSLGYFLVKIRKLEKTDKNLSYLSLLGGGLVVSMITVDFWTRYWVMVVPLIILATGAMFKNKNWVLVLLTGLSWPWLLAIHRGNPKILETELAKQISIDGYQEMYRLISQKDQLRVSEEDWQKTWRRLKKDTLSVKIEANANDGVLYLKYRTRLGELNHSAKLNLGKENNRWVIFWDWGYLLPQFTGKEEIISETNLAINQIFDQNGKLVAKVAEWPVIWVVPRETYDIEGLQSMLERVSILPREENWKRFYGVVPDKYPAEIGWVKSGVSEVDLKRLVSINSIRIELRKRLVLDEALRKTSLADYFDELIEKDSFWPNGRIYLINGNKEVVLVDKQSKKEGIKNINNAYVIQASGSFNLPNLGEFRPLAD